MNLQEFSFGNFRSFKDLNTLNLLPAKIKSKNNSFDKKNIIYSNEASFLKAKAIYGANASGKSNITRALIAFLSIIDSSVKNTHALDVIDNFRLSTETENEPTFFQMIFWLDSIKYRYGFEVTDQEVVAEWLFGTKNVREQAYFIRDSQEIIKLDKTNFQEGDKVRKLLSDKNSEIFRNNSLYLSSLASFGFSKLSKKIVEAITSTLVIDGLGDESLHNYARNSLSREIEKKYILNMLKIADIGIEDIEDYEIPIEDMPEDIDDSAKEKLNKSKFLISSRKKFDDDGKEIGIAPMMFKKNESEGTKKLFELSPIIYKAIQDNSVLFIDEFDARFHPLLTQKIVELFNSEQNSGAQLVFITHDTNLLNADILRRDQIDFVEKDKYGASHTYSLIEFKGTRKDSLFEKNYIQGKYGAIPFLGDFEGIIG